MNKNAALWAAMAIALLPTPVRAGDTIRVLAFEYPPIYQDTPQDKGLACDLVTASFQAVGVEVELNFQPVKRMVANVGNGDALCAIGGRILFSDSGTSGRVTFSSVVLYVVQTFVYDVRKHPKGIHYSDLAELGKYRIGVLGGSGIMRFLERTPGLHLASNTFHEGSARQLHLGRTDLWAIVDLTGAMYLKNLYPAEHRHFRTTRPYNIGDVSLVFAKARDPDNAYNRKFQTGLKIIKDNGTYMEIMARYYGSPALVNPDALPEDMKPDRSAHPIPLHRETPP